MSYRTISEMFYQTTEKFADKHLYYEKKQDWWQGLRGKDIRSTVEELAFALKSHGVQNGVHVAIVSNNSPRWAMSDYAILCAGGTTVAIYPVLPPDQIAYILANSESKIIFVQNEEQGAKVLEIWDECPNLEWVVVMDDSKITEKSPDGDKRHITTYIELLDAGSEHGREAGLDFQAMCMAATPDDLLTLIYTSGTTGKPKGVMLTHSNLVSNIEAALTHISINDEDVLLSFLPLSHSFERMAGHFLAFSRGAATYYAESIEKVGANMLEVHPTVLLGAPRFYEKVYNRVLAGVAKTPALRQKIFWWAIGVGKEVLALNLVRKKPGAWLSWKHGLANKLVYSKLLEKVGGRIRFFVSGSAPLSAAIADFFGAANLTILEGYGLTETSPAVTVSKLELFKTGKVGPPIPGVEVRIAADGEILVRGPNIMKGYFKNDEATREAIDDDNWFHTGDIGEFDDDNYLKITDRKKNILVTSGGKNVVPAALENALAVLANVDQVCILGDGRNFISALVVPNFEALNAYAAERGLNVSGNEELVNHPEIIGLVEKEVEQAMEPFARYEKIKKIALLPQEFTIDGGELTPTLKVKRKVVLERYSSVIEGIYAGAIADAPTG